MNANTVKENEVRALVVTTQITSFRGSPISNCFSALLNGLWLEKSLSNNLSLVFNQFLTLYSFYLIHFYY